MFYKTTETELGRSVCVCMGGGLYFHVSVIFVYMLLKNKLIVQPLSKNGELIDLKFK